VADNQPPSSMSPEKKPSGEGGNTQTLPSVSLPKGGGALRGIGEKFATDPTSGTASLSIPLATSEGRSGFGPHLSLSYDSGGGNGAFGMGWNLSLPSITRKTDKGLPRYRDTEESDIYVLSGSEDLVPLRGSNGTLVEDTTSHPGFVIHRYRPRVEGLFSRIERWTEASTGVIHWRSITRDNTTTLYGKDENSRITDPADPLRIFRWLMCDSRDDKGNAITYEYAAENAYNVAPNLNERNRVRTANRYIKRIRYGNRVSHLVTPTLTASDFLFEVVFDYEEGHHQQVPLDPALPAAEQHQFVLASAAPLGPWAARPDPFSSYRSGFEVRTHRRCRRVLMFHHIPDLPTGERGYEGLVTSTEFDYADLDYTRPFTVSDELEHQGSTRIASFIRRIIQSGYVRDDSRPVVVRNGVPFATYLQKSMAPLEIEYSKAVINDTIRTVDIENVPAGLHELMTQWIDLHGEGSSGILTESAGAWYYKRNLSPLAAGDTDTAQFAAIEKVAEKPNASLRDGARFVDIAGDGMPDVVMFNDPLPGFWEHDDGESWQPFRPFSQRLNRQSEDPNLRFVDLDGDGRADVLITEDDALVWYPSLGAQGFGTPERIIKPFDEERGPRLVFADGTQSIYLADMSGDGLADLVRIRNGEVCYWPNVGYGHFGTKVGMDHSPWFDHPDQFDQRRVRLADIDGSGTSDVIYLAADGARLYFNQSGNRLSDPRLLPQLHATTSLTSVAAIDLLGNGTTCLVWSSAIPSDAAQPLRYIDVMGGQKPHLLTRFVSNLGGETEISYASSTRFFVQDKHAGRPWVTRLPFPVHVVDRVLVRDRISGNLFTTRHTYHHGYFDGVEREFHGFGMVETVDTEEFAALTPDGSEPAGMNFEASSHVPPVLTRTWFHTGVFIGREHVSNFFAGLLDVGDVGEYYREPGLDDAGARALLLDDTVLPEGLSIEAEREACRALKGSMLRQEVYALDGTDKQPHPYTVNENNFTIRMMQAPLAGSHGIFHVHARESINFHYDRRPADPRIGHSLTLEVDDFGNVLRSATVAYGRRQPDSDLSTDEQAEQARLHIVQTENRVTTSVDAADAYRAPLLCEVRTSELAGLSLPAGQSRFIFDDVSGAGLAAVPINYEDTPTAGQLQKRLIEHTRSYYRRNDLSGPLPLGQLESLGLPFEGYKQAFSPGLVSALLGGRATPAQFNEGRYVATQGEPDYWIPSGRTFLSPGPNDKPAQELAFAVQHFFLPRRYRDPFHTAAVSTESFVTYDFYDLLVEETRDALGNRSTVGERNVDPTRPQSIRRQDYRTLRPALVMDANRNRTEIAFDALGMVVGTAVMGKPEDSPVPGDRLTATFRRDLTESEILGLFADPTGPLAATLLDAATSRVVFDLLAYARQPGTRSPIVSTTLTRETHVSDVPPSSTPRIFVNFVYSDGLGRQTQKKVQAEPGPVPQRDAEGHIIIGPDGTPVMTTTPTTLRWVGSGWTVFNNKGKPVRKFEPFFTDTHRFEFNVRIGVSPIIMYDPIGRIVASVQPNHVWQKGISQPWRQEAWDGNDTALLTDPKTDPDVGDFFRRLPETDYLPTWYALRTDPANTAALAVAYPDPVDRSAEQSAAAKTAVYAATPKVAHIDSLGRTFLTIIHNRYKYSNAPATDPPIEKFCRNRSRFDVEGNELEVIDALGRVVMRYSYDLVGRRVVQASMEQGTRWMLNDVTGQPLYLWDSRGQILHTTYDQLRRPAETVLDDGTTQRLLGRATYGESRPNPESSNLRGHQVELLDQAGVAVTDAFDFKGNVLRTSRQLAQTYSATLDWSTSVPLQAETYTGRTRYDALNRPTQVIVPHADTPGAVVNVIQPSYNQAGLLERVDAWLNGATEPSGVLAPSTANLHAITNIDYDPRGQRELVDHGNGVRMTYTYDPLTHRLVRLVSRRDAAAFPSDCPSSPPAGWPGCQVQSLHYVFDPVGNVTELRDDAQQTIFFSNQRVDPIANYTYDATYRLIEATGREHLGQIGGTPIPHSYSDAGRVAPTDGQAMARYLERYVYDATSNLAEMQHVGTQPAAFGWTRTFSYEETSQLDVSQHSNRLTRTTVGTTVESYSTGGDGYDAHGNILRMPHLQEMRWDYRDQLQMSRRQAVSADGQGGVAHLGERTFYVYDSTGLRVRKVTETPSGQLKDERVYLGICEIYRRFGANPLVRETLHIKDGATRVALVETRTQGSEPGVPRQLIRYQLGNHLGSVALELDDAAQIVSYEEYTPYGSSSFQAVRPQLSSVKRYRFLGQERDEENGFGYHGARYYVPWLARFCNTDPAALADGPNLYVYAHGNPIVRFDPGGFQDVTIHHRTTESSAASMTKTGVRTDVSSSHVWAGEGFYGSSTPNIPGNVGASGETIVAQQISTEKMKTITDEGFVKMMQDEGKELRSLVRAQMRDQARTKARTAGSVPSDPEIDKYMRDYMNKQLDRIAPGADVVRWQNPDGTFTYVVRNPKALRGEAQIVGHVKGGQFHPAETRAHAAATHAPSEPHAPHVPTEPHVPHVPTEPHVPHGPKGSKGGTIGKVVAVGIALYVLIKTEDAYAAGQTLNPLANTTDTALSGSATVGSVAESLAKDAYQLTPLGTIDFIMFDILGPRSILDPDHNRVYDQRLADKAIKEGRNPFCAQCHGPGGALDPDNEWNRKHRDGPLITPNLLREPANDDALRDYIKSLSPQ
jgi:RHS repeat-associated protein